MNLFPVDIIGVTNEHGGGCSKTIPAPTISQGVCDSHEQLKRNTTTFYPNTRQAEKFIPPWATTMKLDNDDDAFMSEPLNKALSNPQSKGVIHKSIGHHDIDYGVSSLLDP